MAKTKMAKTKMAKTKVDKVILGPDLFDLLNALHFFLDAYDEWNDRVDGGEDSLHYAAKVSKNLIGRE